MPSVKPSMYISDLLRTGQVILDNGPSLATIESIQKDLDLDEVKAARKSKKKSQRRSRDKLENSLEYDPSAVVSWSRSTDTDPRLVGLKNCVPPAKPASKI